MTPYVVVGVLSGLASLLLFIGVRFARRSKRPKLFRVGSMTAASGLILLWIGMWWVFSVDWGILAMPIFVAALLVPISLLGLGIQLMGRACGAPEESHNDRLFADLLRQNDLP